MFEYVPPSIYENLQTQVNDIINNGGGGNIGGTGNTGPTGRQGFQGAQGIAGSTGHTGSIGIQGMAGLTGLTGQSGYIGIQGFTGVKGVTGITGPTGIQGLNGPTGIIGNTGPQGKTGDTGLTGFQGSTGFQGLTGFQGSTGVRGLTGFTGIIGAVGITGATGQTGRQGQTGITGSQGQTGSQGTIGTIGLTGPNGIVTSGTLTLVQGTILTTAVGTATTSIVAATIYGSGSYVPIGQITFSTVGDYILYYKPILYISPASTTNVAAVRDGTLLETIIYDAFQNSGSKNTVAYELFTKPEQGSIAIKGSYLEFPSGVKYITVSSPTTYYLFCKFTIIGGTSLRTLTFYAASNNGVNDPYNTDMSYLYALKV